jgi:GH43 family beta-xylosidase
MNKLKIKIMMVTVVCLAAALMLGMWMMTNNTKDTAAYNGHGGTFKNPLTDIDTPDPSVVYADGYYYMTFTHNGTDIMVMKSRTLDFHQAERKVVWYPPVGTMYSANLWAPEIQYLQGRWYIYFAADDGNNENHRMYALEADSEDPLGSYTFKGQITDETDKWAIDGLALEHKEQLYFIWSGWEGDVNIQQNTYIAQMSDPLTISGSRVLLSEPELEWEKTGGPPYIQEGQAILKKDGHVFLAYSGAGSWTPFYSIGMLTLVEGGDPLVASNWIKSQTPLMQMDEEAGVFGPGHNSFVTSPDGSEDWIVYHATSGISDGWNNRKARAQKVQWNEAGMPEFGKPLSLDTAITVPSGEGVFESENAVITGDKLEYKMIRSTIETKAPLLIRYRNVSNTPQSIDIWSNDAKAAAVDLPATEAGEDGYAYTIVPLIADWNKISLINNDSGVEVISIELPRYEAEAAQAELNGLAEDNPFTSGRGGVTIEQGEGDALQFSQVSVPVSGTYQLHFAFSNPTEQHVDIQVMVNGKKAGLLSILPTGRNIFQDFPMEIMLKSGPNAITLKDASGRLDLDYMDITH